MSPCLAILWLAAAEAVPDTAPPPRIVRRFEEFVVRSRLHDPRSSETVHLLPAAALRTLPVDALVQAVALKAGVVARGEQLHVRGGRSGEVRVQLHGLPLREPWRGRALALPLVALQSAELVSGGMDAEHGGALAGVVDLRTVEPGERQEGEALWRSDGGLDTRYDRLAARWSGPLAARDLGAVVAADVELDGTHLPSLRSAGRRELLGASVGWRSQNRWDLYGKLSAGSPARRLRIESLGGRRIEQPFDPMWTLDGWTAREPDPVNCPSCPGYSPTPLPGFERYRAADHAVMTDARHRAVLVSGELAAPRRRLHAAAAWIETRRLTSVGARDDPSYVQQGNLPAFGVFDLPGSDAYRVYAGDEPFFQRVETRELAARADGEMERGRGTLIAAGAGFSHQRVKLHELDGFSFGQGLDSLRAFDEGAPGGFAYVQMRWPFQGLVLNAGLRAERFTAGPDAGDPPGAVRGEGLWSLAPRLGVAYPVSDRDVFSLSYVHVKEDPARDFLHDNRRVILNRQPLGNPRLEPATMISYQAAVKHLFDARWALQGAVFYRDLFGLVGARNASSPSAPPQLRYQDSDFGHAEGFELTVLFAPDETSRAELHYTWLRAIGSQSLEEGVPFGARRGLRPEPLGEHPLDWDRRHTLVLTAAWPLGEHATLGLATVAGSGFPWTPRERRTDSFDLSRTNSRRLSWQEQTDLLLRWAPGWTGGHAALLVEVRNLFDQRGETAVTADGYPHPVINTAYDDYGAYRTETGQPGGAYWNDRDGDGLPGWIPVGDPRLFRAPRLLRLGLGLRW